MQMLIFNEQEFTDWVLHVANTYGWLAYHTYDSTGSVPGFPDLVMLKPTRRIIFAELKMPHGTFTEHQIHWKVALEQHPDVDYYVWQPTDWAMILHTLH